MKQEYVLKKYVVASSLAEAIALDSETPVCEAFYVAEARSAPADAVGFQRVIVDE